MFNEFEIRKIVESCLTELKDKMKEQDEKISKLERKLENFSSRTPECGENLKLPK